MKRHRTLIRGALAVLAAAALLGAAYDASNFSALGRQLQPPPSGHVPGKDNGPGLGRHNAGEECGACHRPGGKAPTAFTAAGTLYQDRAGRKPLKGGEIILQDINGKVISMTSNEVGNFWTYAPIASNPNAVVSHGGMTRTLYWTDEQGFHPADPNDARSWQYKAWVKSKDYVIAMVTVAPVGGATDPSSRMSCNMHHAPMGSRGALWTGGKSTLASYPSSNLGFKQHVSPILRNKCAPCHIPGETWTRLVTHTDVEGSPLTKVDYSKLLDLTSYGGSTVTVGGTAWTKRGVKDVATGHQASPDASPLLARTRVQPGGAMVHPGGVFWKTTDADYKALRQWILEGALDN